MALECTTTNADGTSLTALAGYTLHCGHSRGGYDVTLDVGHRTRLSCTGR